MSRPLGISARLIALGDLDGDQDLEIVHTIGHSGVIYAWDVPRTGSLPVSIEWGQVGHDPTGGYSYHRGRGSIVGFLRGDSNGDGVVNIADVVSTARQLFGPESPSCPAALDVDWDESLSVADIAYLVNMLFLHAAEPLPPFPACDLHLAPLGLGCEPPQCP